FLEKNAGGEDPLLDAKMDLIKNLPPVEALRETGAVDNSEIQTASDAIKEDKEEASSDLPPSSGVKKKP
ncbi:MAG TPA: hypothetical protein PLH57_08040, partial [Oligoflexia bacterium]|nr:hypothetical protein [Oligoflexia bacterium]